MSDCANIHKLLNSVHIHIHMGFQTCKFDVHLNIITNGQRTQMKGHIAPTLSIPTVGEFTLKPRFHRDAVSSVDKSAAPHYCGIYCLHTHTPV